MQPFAAAPIPEDYAMITGFTHLFSSPVWWRRLLPHGAEVLDADAFTRFQGRFSQQWDAIIATRSWLAAIVKIQPSCTGLSGRDPDLQALRWAG